MKSAARIATLALGVYAGLLGMEHGVFEILQGNVAPAGLLINALGPPCQADTVWHACYPALTIVPNFLVTGVLTIVTGLVVLIWAAALVGKKHGGLVLILLSVLMLPVGGGFIAPFIGIVAGVTGTRIGAPLTGWPNGLLRALGRLWPWPLIILALWVPGAWVLGYFFNQTMLSLGPVLFLLFDLVLPLLLALTGLAVDTQRRLHSQHQDGGMPQ
ncbi:MAG: hypothetical protein KKA73_13360 [Chloroflexi bacterium]|nr:hypothetical protein [Chloroflexota bacterium]MBU1748670.1 hypothetical protein [Chloroflexota bacterium]MBU1879977.1 hypothetical protein [Chloroflexota bacterium]